MLKMRFLRPLLTSAIAAAALTATLVPSALADTIVTQTLISGNGSVGGPDSAVSFTLGGLSGPATVVNTNAAWGVIPGTQWVDFASCTVGGLSVQGCSHPAGSGAFGELNPATYSIGFSLPAGALSPSLSVDVNADNCADVFLNGSLFGSQAPVASCINPVFFTLPPSTFSTSTGFMGANVLRFDVTDGGVIAGVDFKATLTYTLDTTPPTVTCSATPNSLWPPNHKLSSVTTTVNVADAGSGPAGFELVSVTSNEADNGLGDGNTTNDIQDWTVGTSDTAGLFRAERSGLGTGRVYTLTYVGKDVAGNTAQCSTTVTVPHDQGN
jgi:hypothetical protein